MRIILILIAIFAAGYFFISNNKEKKEEEKASYLIEKQIKDKEFKEKYLNKTIDFVNSLGTDIIDYRDVSFFNSYSRFTYSKQKQLEKNFNKEQSYLFVLNDQFNYGSILSDYYINNSNKYIVVLDNFLSQLVIEFEFSDDIISYINDMQLNRGSGIYVNGKFNNFSLSKELKIDGDEEEVEKMPVQIIKASFVVENYTLSKSADFNYHFDLKFKDTKLRE